MTQLTQLRVYRPAPSPAAPPSWEWLLTPDNGQGFLEINGTLYKVTEFGFTYDNGAGGRLWKLRKADGTEYQLTQTADADLACDCPDATYRGRECKHVLAVREAYAALDRSDRLGRWLAAMETPADVCPSHSADDYRNKSHDAVPMPF